MNLKKYPKIYEDVFTAARTLNKCKLEKVSTDADISTEDYRRLLRTTINKFEKSLFDQLVKIFWLMRRFCYGGYHRGKKRYNGFYLDAAFGVFMRSHVGVESRMITRDQVYSKIADYFDDFFPEFDARNPFKEKYKYPYKYMRIEYLVIVYQMPERLELLRECEKKKMSYTQFLDYIINYIKCYNEEVGYKYYTFAVSHVYMPYVRINKKQYEESQTAQTSDI